MNKKKLICFVNLMNHSLFVVVIYFSVFFFFFFSSSVLHQTKHRWHSSNQKDIQEKKDQTTIRRGLDFLVDCFKFNFFSLHCSMKFILQVALYWQSLHQSSIDEDFRSFSLKILFSRVRIEVEICSWLWFSSEWTFRVNQTNRLS